MSVGANQANQPQAQQIKNSNIFGVNQAPGEVGSQPAPVSAELQALRDQNRNAPGNVMYGTENDLSNSATTMPINPNYNQNNALMGGGTGQSFGLNNASMSADSQYMNEMGSPTYQTQIEANNKAATTTSNPNTATLGTGQTTSPYINSTNPYIQAAQATTMGNLYGAQQATQANRINQNTPYSSLNYTQGVDAQGNPTWTANQQLAQPLQKSLQNIQGQLSQSTATPFDASQYQAQQVGQGPQFSQMGNAANLQNQVQGTGMEGWDAATGLLMNRLNPQIQQSNDRLTAQLANQGVVPGTEAYNRAMTQQGQKTNDLLTQAQLAGSQVQNTMFGQNLAAGQFGNTALTQQNQNQLANLGFNNQMGQQGFANQMAGTQANNAATQQNYANALQQKNMPLQQLGAFQQATTPGYVNPYSQAAIAGPDYLGAYSTSNAQQIAAQNAANAKTANTQAGLYGLGGAALLGGGGVSGLASGIGSGLSSISDWYNSLGFGNSGMTSGMINGGVTGNNYDAFGNLISSGNAAPAAADWASAFGGTTGIGG